MFDQIEQLKTDLTDKYVVVDASIPELRRFDGYLGQVKTVNMSGRALVQFEAWANIGWYDIDVDYLKVVDKAEAEAVKSAKEAQAKAAPAEKKAAAAPAAKKAAAPAAAKPPAEKKAAAPAGGGAKMSVAEMLAAARTNKPGGAPAASAAAAETASSEASAAPAVAEKPVAEKPAAKPAASKPAAAAPALKKESAPSVAEMLAWCRANDAK